MEFTMAILFFVFPLTRAELRHSSEKERKKREREREREEEQQKAVFVRRRRPATVL
jgi:hypothetical protein